MHSHEQLLLSALICLPSSSIITLRHTRWNIPLINLQTRSARPITGQQVETNEDERKGQEERERNGRKVNEESLAPCMQFSAAIAAYTLSACLF